MAEPFLPLARPTFDEDDIAEVTAAMRSGWVTGGPRVARFESGLAQYLKAEHVQCLNSCTAGLTLALHLLGVGPGDEVIVPAMTFVACANVVVRAGARPVLVDSEPDTGAIDLDAAAAAIGPRTRALMVVHLGGRPLDMDAVGALRDRTGVPVVEDAAHAIGAAWRGRAIGSWGNLTSFSFHAGKNLTTFDGGALVAPDLETAQRARRLAVQGITRSAWARHGDAAPGHYDVLEPGFKLAMHDVAAAAGIHQLARLDAGNARRAELAARYDELLADLPLVLAPPPPALARHAHHVYAVRVARARDEVALHLQRRGIGTSIHFRAIHLHDWYRRNLPPADLPVATRLSEELLSLPLYPSLQDRDLERVAEALAEATALSSRSQRATAMPTSSSRSA